jgi:quercetin dioxygenase-like cupin family protein
MYACFTAFRTTDPWEDNVKTVTISDARRFSLVGVQRRPLISQDGLTVELVCFEAGQAEDVRSASASVVYQVLEGEALVRVDDATLRLGKGKLLSIEAGKGHALENAGGGLLVVLATQAQ